MPLAAWQDSEAFAPHMCAAEPGEWSSYVQRTTARLAAELGVHEPQLVEAQLYKLLLYQTGDHFVAHRDTEKAPSMFATMAIILPSSYTVRITFALQGHHRCGCRSNLASAQAGMLVYCWAIIADTKMFNLTRVTAWMRLDIKAIRISVQVLSEWTRLMYMY